MRPLLLDIHSCTGRELENDVVEVHGHKMCHLNPSSLGSYHGVAVDEEDNDLEDDDDLDETSLLLGIAVFFGQ